MLKYVDSKRVEKIILVAAPLAFLVGATLASMMLTGCGKSQAHKQTQEQFVAPNFPPQGQGFYLNPSDEMRSFSGTMLVWNSEVTTDNVQRVLKVNGASTAMEIEKLKYMRDNVVPAAADLEEAMEERANAEEAVKLDTLQTSLTAADGLFERLLGTVNGIRPVNDIEALRARRVFGYYCEAKLWERAVQNQLITATYTRRPLPAAMCATVYRKLGLISEAAPECAPSKEGKNYFECLWKQGVVKTQLFSVVYSSHAALAAKLNKIDTNLLMNKYNFGAIGNSQSRSFLQLKKIRLKNEAGEAAGDIDAVTNRQTEDLIVGARSISDIIAQVEDGRLALMQLPAPTPTEPTPPSEGMPQPEPQQPQAPSAPTAPAPAPLAASVPTVAAPVAAVVPVVPVVIEDPAKGFEIAFRERLSKFLRLSDGLWVNEVLMNAPYAKDLKDEFKTLKTEVDAEMRRLLPEVCDVKADQRLLNSSQAAAEHVARLVVRGAEILAPINGSANCDEKGDVLSCRAAKAGKEQIEVARDVAISQALLSTQLTLPRKGEANRVQISMTLDRNAKKKVEACFDINQDKQVACSEGASLIEAFKVDRVSGRILVIAKINDVADFGLQKRGRNEDDLFNEIASDLTGKYVSVEMYPNNFDKLLDFVSGSVKFSENADGTSALAAGNISMRDEAPLVKVVTDKFESRVQKLTVKK